MKKIMVEIKRGVILLVITHFNSSSSSCYFIEVDEEKTEMRKKAHEGIALLLPTECSFLLEM